MKDYVVNLRWKILVLRYLAVLLPDRRFLTHENEKLQRDMSLELQAQYNERSDR